MKSEIKYGNMPVSVVNAVKEAFKNAYNGNALGDSFGHSQFMSIVLPVLAERWPEEQKQNSPASDEVLRLLREILGAKDGESILDVARAVRNKSKDWDGINEQLQRIVEAMDLKVGDNAVAVADRHRRDALVLEHVRKALGAEKGRVLAEVSILGRELDNLRAFKDAVQAALSADDGTDMIATINNWRQDRMRVPSIDAEILREVREALGTPIGVNIVADAKRIRTNVETLEEVRKVLKTPPGADTITHASFVKAEADKAPQKENNKAVGEPKQTATCNDPPFQSPWDAASQLLVKVGSPLRSDSVFREFFERNAARADYISCDPGFPGDFACCVAITKKDGVVTIVDHTTWCPEVSLGVAAKRYIFELTRTDQKKLDRVMQEHVLSAMQEVLTEMQRFIPSNREYAELFRRARQSMGYSYNELRDGLVAVDACLAVYHSADMRAWEKSGLLPAHARIAMRRLLCREIAKLTEKLAQN